MARPMPRPLPPVRLWLFAAVLGAAWPGSVRASEATFELTGVMQSEGRTRIALVEKATGATSWLAVGEAFRGHTFKSYDATEQTAVLAKDGAETRLRLVGAQIRHGEAEGRLSPKTAKAIYHNVRQIAAAADQYYLEHGKTSATLEDLVGPDKIMKRLVNVAGEDYSTIVLKLGTPVVLTTAGGDVIPADPADRANATFAFSPLRGGETGMKIANQMNLSVNELVALNPDINFARLRVGEIVRVK